MLVNFNLTAQNNINVAPAGFLRDGIPPSPAPDISGGTVAVPNNVSVLTLGGSFKRPYVQSWNLVLEKDIGWGFTASAGYVATRTVGQAGSFDVNAGRPGLGTAGQPLNVRFPGRNAPTTLYDGFANSHYDSLQTSLKRRFSNGLQMQANYTWSKAMGLVNLGGDNDSGLAINDPAFRNLNRAVLNIDTPHNIQFSGGYELPLGKGRRWLSDNRLASAFAGGWQLSWLFGAFSGTPFSVTASGTSLNAPNNTQRADQVKAEVKKLGGIGLGTRYYDTTAFAPVTGARYGTAGFNSLRSPETVNLDFGIFREFRITEGIKLQFRTEVFNATNTPHFDRPTDANRDVTSPGFLAVTQTRQFGREGIDERVFRFGLRLGF
jgi:hypothetical protein